MGCGRDPGASKHHLFNERGGKNEHESAKLTSSDLQVVWTLQTHTYRAIWLLFSHTSQTKTCSKPFFPLYINSYMVWHGSSTKHGRTSAHTYPCEEKKKKKKNPNSMNMQIRNGSKTTHSRCLPWLTGTEWPVFAYCTWQTRMFYGRNKTQQGVPL